jgi:hypothetical protein
MFVVPALAGNPPEDRLKAGLRTAGLRTAHLRPKGWKRDITDIWENMRSGTSNE